MGSSSDDYAALRALLKLKRYEQPHPRYFNDLPQGIVQRLRGPEGLRRQSLWSLLGLEFGLKPAFFCGLGVTCCLAALYGAAYLLMQGPPVTMEGQAATFPGVASVDGITAITATQLASPDLMAFERGLSIDPVLSSEGLTFPLDGFRVRPTAVRYDLQP